MLTFASLFHSGSQPIGLVLIEVIVLVLTSAVCSGLNISLMSLDVNDLRRKAKLGDRMAKRVLPLRQRTHLVLVSILLTNIAAVSGTSLVLGQRISGWLAWVLATLLIVVLGEVMPQAFFARNPLRYTSRFAPVLHLMVVVTYIISKPLSDLLNSLFPKRPVELQSRQELGLLITEHLTDGSSELDDDEIEIMRGALSLSEKRVRDITTDIRHTYWLMMDMQLDEAKIDEIKAQGFSRIPVFDKALTKCHGILLMKDLVDIDFDDNHFKVEDMELHPAKPVGSMTALDTLFRKFISARGHLLPVERDDVIIGIVTIEDLIEEILGHEIEDETDRKRGAANLQSKAES